MANKIPLPNGCYYSLSVYPKNWKSARANPNLKWYIKYRFYESGLPLLPVIIKGMNEVKELQGKQVLTEKIKSELIEFLKSGYNPNKKEMVRQTDSEVNPGDTLQFALDHALKKAKLEPNTRTSIKSSLGKFLEAATIIHYSNMPVNSVRRKHIITILEKCEEINPKFTDYTFNHYRSDLSILFKELVKREAIEFNPVDEFLEKRKITKKIRETLTDEQRKMVDIYLFKNNYNFWRFMQIFFHSGARIIELMRLQVKDVELNNQRYKITIKKGKNRNEVWKIIKDISLPLWKQLLINAIPNYYVFSVGSVPGSHQVKPLQVARKWRRNVKVPLGITADFYSLRHTHSDQVAELLSIQDAAKHNSHTNTAMVVDIYAVGEKERQRQRIKTLQNKF